MRGTYGSEFKRERVEKVLDGQSVASLARELGIGGKSDSCLEERLFTKWQCDTERQGMR
jgi:hypothetical protein